MRSDVRLPGRANRIGVDFAGVAARVTGVSAGPSRRWVAIGGAVAGLSAAHAYALTLPQDQASPWAIASHGYAIALLAGLLWLAWALGLRVLHALGITSVPRLEATLVSLGLGLGGLAYLVLACGLLGLLRPPVLAAILATLVVVLRSELAKVASATPSFWRAYLAQRRSLQEVTVLRLTLPLAELLLALLLLRALAPPTGYDALVYHLEGPRQFLQLGRMAPLVEPHPANMPFTVEMLYLLGLAFGSDELPNLLHLSMAVLTALATFAFGCRFFGPRVGWLAAAIVLSAPTLVFFAPLGNIDFGWALFDFLAVYAFAVWTRERRPSWLMVAGLAAGLSLGSKYFGLLTCAALTLGVLVEAVRGSRPRPVQVAWLLAQFLVPAALVAAPWYVKSWIWLGSPIAPVWPNFGAGQFGAGQTPEIDAYLARHMNGEHSLRDLLMLPLRLFRGDPEIPLARPPLLFALVPLYLLVRKHRLVTYLLVLAAIHLVAWSQISSTVRYLAPVFPELSLAVAYLLDRGMRGAWPRGAGRYVLPSTVVLSLVMAAVQAVMTLAIERPFAQLVGLESREAYRGRVLPDYGAVQYLNAHRGEVTRVLIVGDARLYYLTTPFLIDHGLGIAVGLHLADDPVLAAAQLRQAGVSHVLIGYGHLGFLTQFDPEDRIVRWLQDFERIRPAYLAEAYSTPNVVGVYRLVDDLAAGDGE